ncbi:Adenylate cyclase [Minicystis rosea]|nr:Adenylate cyclase [Minicystis rosea]
MPAPAPIACSDGAGATSDPGATRPAHDFLAPALFALIAEVHRASARVMAMVHGAPDPEAIHDFRVALRRLRTVLRPARKVFGKRRLRALGGALRRFAQATGTLRDDEVLRETLGALALPPRAQAELAAWLAQRTRQERARRRAALSLLTATDDTRGPSLATALAHLERRLGQRRREGVDAGGLAASAIADALLQVQDGASADPRDVAAMHDLRVRFKRLRYLADLFAPLLGERGLLVTKASARMQRRLGELHDIDEALLRIGRARSLSEKASVVVRRKLVQARRAAVGRARRELAAELERIVTTLA